MILMEFASSKVLQKEQNNVGRLMFSLEATGGQKTLKYYDKTMVSKQMLTYTSVEQHE